MNKRSIQMIRVRGLLMAIFIIAAISSMATAADAPSYPRTIVDDAGREITIKMPIEKIIALDANAAKAVYLLGAGDKIIAVGDDVILRGGYLPGAKEKQSVGKWHEYDYELIGELARDGDKTPPNTIVLCSVSGQDPAREIAQALKDFPEISVIGLDLYKMENVTDDLEKLGIVLDEEDRVQDNINWHQDKISQIKKAVKGKPLPKVYIEMSTSKGVGDLSTYGLNSSFNKLIEMTGGYNILREPKVYSKVTWEWVMIQNPEIILRTGAVDTLGWTKGPSQDSLELETTRNEILSRPGSDKIRAIQNDQVYTVWNSMLYGFDSVVGAAFMAKIFHPEIDLDPYAICKEYMSRLGLDFPDDRVLVYPSPQK
ncbi:MAG: corrinoid ABC transporter substrate-binding protein [Methanosaeta sp. PtaU1.Bin060]|jgi:iron complex transport system substrate-binding protein|nr:MAG: corrinoid ABC transporter substrate-binding protein [Methanosaeta sp. PtaU1.Bin060]